jgi:hypothetical protein
MIAAHAASERAAMNAPIFSSSLTVGNVAVDIRLVRSVIQQREPTDILVSVRLNVMTIQFDFVAVDRVVSNQYLYSMLHCAYVSSCRKRRINKCYIC